MFKSVVQKEAAVYKHKESINILHPTRFAYQYQQFDSNQLDHTVIYGKHIVRLIKKNTSMFKTIAFPLHSKKQLKKDVIFQGLDKLIQREVLVLDSQLVYIKLNTEVN